MIVHSRFSGVVLSRRWMDGSATFTTVLSSMIMNSAKHMAASVHHLWFARSESFTSSGPPWIGVRRSTSASKWRGKQRERLLAFDRAHEACGLAEAEEQHRDGFDVGVRADAPVGLRDLDRRAHARLPCATIACERRRGSRARRVSVTAR